MTAARFVIGQIVRWNAELTRGWYEGRAADGVGGDADVTALRQHGIDDGWEYRREAGAMVAAPHAVRARAGDAAIQRDTRAGPGAASRGAALQRARLADAVHTPIRAGAGAARAGRASLPPSRVPALRAQNAQTSGNFPSAFGPICGINDTPAESLTGNSQPNLKIGSVDDPLEAHPGVRSNQAIVRAAGAALQRKCACDGECPTCKAEKRKEEPHGLQAKLRVNIPGDAFEQEADRVADAVAGIGAGAVCLSAPAGQAQRKGGAVSAGAGAAPGNLTGGHALAPSLRAPLERSLGHDFSDVRVHSDSAAAQAAAAVNARAYTLGRDVVFGAGQYAPETSAGMHLLVHELTHFTQQGQGAPKMVMRAAGDAAGTTPQPPFMGANFSFRPDDPPCSAAPRGLGQIVSEVDCPVATEDIGFQGHHFHFCVGSDVFASPKTPTELLNFVRRQPAASRFKVHGYASTIGDPADNDRLSCHRALRVAREMINDGVPAENIDVARHGQTDEFTGGPDFNQVAVVLPVPPPPVSGPAENLPFDTHDQKLAIVEGAREGLRAGTYNLGADAYISFWTCGKIKTVSDAVDRMHVRFEGDPGLSKVEEGGQAEGLGTNVIAVSQATLAAVNQNACITERLVDMAFHQMTLGTIGTAVPRDRAFDLRHQGARYLAALGGFEACNSPGTPVPLPADDPLGFEAAPDCAETPLATRLDTTRKAPAPSFSATSQWQVSSGRIGWEIDFGANRALMTVPAFPIAAQANVQATGDPKSFPDFELGYMQTVTDDSTVVNYVSGHTLEIRVPTPIRDRERNPSRAPFFSSDFVSTPDVSGHASARMFKVTATEVPLVYEDVESGGRRQAGNVIDTITREAHFVTWLVARRRGAPPDRFDTHFLAGQEFDFTMNVDVLNVDGSGKFATTKSDPSSGSDAVMQFGGPTPEYLGPSELTIVTNPPSRESAAQITRAEFAGILRNISESLQPPELGLKHSKLTLTIFLDADTGRVALPEPDKNFLPFAVTSPNVPGKPRFELGHEVFIRARKRDFLGSPDKAVIVKKDPRDHTSSKHEPVSIDLDPSPNVFLPDRLGVKGAMKGLWQLTEADEQKGDPRGWVLTVYIDRNDQLRPFMPKQGDKPTFEPGRSGGLIVKFREICGGTAADPDNDTPLGTIHTHPNPLGQVLDEDAPSKPDHDNARDGQSLCGVQFFMIDNDTVFEYDADSDHPLGTRKSFLS